jgi:pyruvate dehydrogenase E2 component (dihydrolipoamide acetyltransferase)
VIEFRMPSLGADMEQATLREWRVAPGDQVRRGDVVAVVDTDKAEIEVEAWVEGTVETIVVPTGRTVPVGAVLALLRGTKESAAPAQPAQPSAVTPVAAPAAPPAAAAAPPLAPPSAGERVRATPLARRLAAERGIDLASIAGSGPGGAITQADLTARAPGAPPAPAVVQAPAGASAPSPRTDGMRRAIAAAMQRAKREIPHYYLETAIDFGAARAWLEAANRERPIEERLLPPALLLRGVALALREVPELNGFWADDRLEIADAVHLGFAVSLRTGGGLLAPVLCDADRLGVAEIMARLRGLVSRARVGRLRSSEVLGATCTVTSLGEQGVDKVYGIIHPPQVALVGFGSVREQPWARDGWITARPVLTATLSADHRASDGQRGARFLARLRWRLERPEEL